jgi:hypothetical protein
MMVTTADQIEDRQALIVGDNRFEFLTPAPNDYLQRWPVSKRVNSSKADADDATLIEAIQIAAAK